VVNPWPVTSRSPAPVWGVGVCYQWGYSRRQFAERAEIYTKKEAANPARNGYDASLPTTFDWGH